MTDDSDAARPVAAQDEPCICWRASSPYAPEGWQSHYCAQHGETAAANNAAIMERRHLASAGPVAAQDDTFAGFVLAECEVGHRVAIDDGDGGSYACPLCARPVAEGKLLATRPAGDQRAVPPDTEARALIVETLLSEGFLDRLDRGEGTEADLNVLLAALAAARPGGQR